jgi:hypothetical protein
VRRAALLLTSVIAAAHDARAAQVDKQVEVGTLITQHIVTFDSRPTVAAGVTWVWSPLGHLALGLETAVAGTVLPFGHTDEAPKISVSSSEQSFTLLPRLMLGPRFVPVPNLWLGVSVGGTWIWSRPGADLAIIPYPTAGVATGIRFGQDDRFGLRVAFSYVHYWFAHDAALLAPTLAFTWSN